MSEVFRIEIPIYVEDNTEPGVSQATRKINAFDKANQKTLERLDKMNRTKYQVAIDALDKASGVVQRIGTTVKGLTGKAWRITMKAVDLATAPIRGIINLLKNPIFQIAAITGITFGLKDTIDTFASFEATMSKVKAISGATIDEFEALNAKAKEMGATTKFTASEAGEAFTYMAMAGWDAEKMLGGISGIMSLAAADGLDLATTSDIVTDALTAFNMKAEESGHFADVLATASSSANTNVSMLGESFKYVAPLAGAMKYSVEDISMALGLMANASVKGSMAGTSLKTALANLASPTDSMAKVMQKYGITLTETDGSMKSLRDVIGNIRTSFGRLKETEQAAAASTLFGKEAMAGMLAIINASQEDYDKLAEAIDNADGAAGRMAATMLDNLSGAFTLLQSAAEGVKITIGERLKPHIMSFTTWLTDKMPGIERAAGRAMDFVDNKVKWLTGTINDFTSGRDWEDADIWGKIRIAWDKIITEPFVEWWSATGKEWFAEKASMIGKGIGTGLTGGLLVLLGVDIAGATEDGLSVGAAFAEGFGEGFDGKKVGEAILGAIKGVFKDAGTLFPGGEKASSTSWLSAGAIGLALSKLGVFKLIGKGGRGLMDILKGKGSKDGMPMGSGDMPADYSIATMSVSAQVVNVYGGALRTPGGAAPGGKGVPPIIPTGGPSRLPPGGGPPGLPPGGGQLRLPPGGGMPTTTAPQIPGYGSAAGGYSVYAPVGKGSSVLVGTAGSSFTAGLANAGYALGSGASTIGGAAAVGGASIVGALGGLLGIGSGAVDIYKGAKSTDAKEAKDLYWSGGSKIGMVGAGAAAGAGIGALFGGIGAVPGALIGAGIGGVGALFGGSKVGKAMSDATDEGGGLTKFWENTKQWSKDTWDTTKAGAADAGVWVSNKWNEAGDWIGNKWGGFSNWLDTTVWTPSKDVGISAANVAAGAWSEGKDWVSGKWGNFSDWFDETVWTPAGHAAQIASDWTEEKWGQARDWVGDRWSDFASWLDETAWTPVKGAAQTASQWVGDRWADARTWTSGHWASLSGWFDESIWMPIKGGAQAAGTWTSEQWNEAGAWIKETWGPASEWFAENVWEPIKGAALTAGAWIGDQFMAAKNAISDAWSGVSGWFEDNVWGPVKSGASAAMKWIEDKWVAAKGWFSELSQKGSKETGLITSKGKSSVFEHAWGGMFTRPHMGIVAEDGPEAIIPLTKPSRAQALWQQVGQILGFIPRGKESGFIGRSRGMSGNLAAPSRIQDDASYQAEGGILTKPHMGLAKGSGAEWTAPFRTSRHEESVFINNEPADMTTATDGASSNITIKVEVKAEPRFTIEGGDGDSIDENQVLAVIKGYIRDMTDDIGDEIAERLVRVFTNMPVKGGARA